MSNLKTAIQDASRTAKRGLKRTNAFVTRTSTQAAATGFNAATSLNTDGLVQDVSTLGFVTGVISLGAPPLARRLSQWQAARQEAVHQVADARQPPDRSEQPGEFIEHTMRDVDEVRFVRVKPVLIRTAQEIPTAADASVLRHSTATPGSEGALRIRNRISPEVVAKLEEL